MRPDSPAARLNTPEAKAKATAARKLARPRRTGYALVGIGNRQTALASRVRAEKALGRPLARKHPIHHPDEDPENPNARLVICDSVSYHKLLHSRMRVKAAGGNPNTQKVCSRCKSLKDKSEFNINRNFSLDGLDYFCRPCVSEKNAIQKARRAGLER